MIFPRKLFLRKEFIPPLKYEAVIANSINTPVGMISSGFFIKTKKFLPCKRKSKPIINKAINKAPAPANK